MREQAERLRARMAEGSNLDLDWANLAGEIESVGNSDRRELRSRLGIIVEHLLKLEFSAAALPREGWIRTIGRERRRVTLLLEDSPSLRCELAGLATEAWVDAVEDAASSLRDHGELDAGAAIRAASVDAFVGCVLDYDVTSFRKVHHA